MIRRPRGLGGPPLLKTPPSRVAFSTDRAGFEPAVEREPYAGLANRYLQPLGHLSRFKFKRGSVPLLAIVDTHPMRPQRGLLGPMGS